MYIRNLSIVFFLFLLFSTNAYSANTRYVRVDGGNGSLCDGLADHAYPPVSGTACALSSPNWVFPPRGESTARAAVSGDTVVIESGSFRLGCQNNTTCRDTNVNLTGAGGFCGAGNPFDCYMGAIPSSVTVIGCTTSGCGCTYNTSTKLTTCSMTRPELWGAGRIPQVMQTKFTSGVTIQDIEITDHATCGFGHHIYNCPTSTPNVLSARNGIEITGSSGLTLKNDRIHGLNDHGLFGGSVSNLTVDNTNLDYNAYVGWDGDNTGTCTTCGNSGTLTFKNHSTVRYNGCVESNPGYGTIASNGCYSQDQTGYGDGIGMTDTSGTWVFTDVDISHNTSDGLDLLYCNRGNYSGCTVNIKRSNFEGNAGNQVKVPNETTIEDSTIIGNCAYFNNQSFTCNSSCGGGFGFNNCRAQGNAIVFASNTHPTNTPPKLFNNTILGNGDSLVMVNGQCPYTQVIAKNNIFRGGDDFNGGDTSGLFYQDQSYGSCNPSFVEDYNVCFGTKDQNTWCTGAHDVKTNPLFAGTIQQEGTLYNSANYHDQLTLLSNSPAMTRADMTISGTDVLDYNSFNRGSTWDGGALEFGTTVNAGAVCGNNVKEQGEVCDGTDVNSQTCSTQGFNGGTLGCAANCLSFNTSSCTNNLCGNGAIESNEQCEIGTFPSTSTLDSFTRSNEGPPPSSSWTSLVHSGWGTGHKVVSNQMTAAALDDQGSVYNTSFGPDSEAFMTLPNTYAASDYICIAARITATTDPSGYVVCINIVAGAGNDQWTIQKMTTGDTVILSSLSSQELGAGDAIGISVIGSTITAYYKASGGSWASKGTATDSTYASAGKIGLLTGYDDFVGDDFGGGTMVPNLNGQTCQSQGFSSGSLSCTTACLFNTTQCVSATCGNGTLDSGEACDDGNVTNSDGCSARCESEGIGVEQFLTYASANPNSYFDIHTNRLNMTGVQTNSNTYLRKDFTASYFGDFIHDFKVTINSCFDDGHNHRGGAALWALSANAYTDLSALEIAADGLDFTISCLSNSSTYTWQLYSAAGATATDTFNDSAPVIIRYVRIERSSTTLTAKLYSDAAYTNLIHTLTVTVPTTAYRYLYPGLVYNASLTGMSFGADVENLDLTGGPAASPATPSAFGCQATGATTTGGTYR